MTMASASESTFPSPPELDVPQLSLPLQWSSSSWPMPQLLCRLQEHFPALQVPHLPPTQESECPGQLVCTLIETAESTTFSISSSNIDFSYCLVMVLKIPPLKIPKLKLGVKDVWDAKIELTTPTVTAPINTETKAKSYTL